MTEQPDRRWDCPRCRQHHAKARVCCRKCGAWAPQAIQDARMAWCRQVHPEWWAERSRVLARREATA